MLMITERTVDSLIYSKDKQRIEELDRELSKVIEDFKHAVDVEALCLAKKSGKHRLFQSCSSLVSVTCLEEGYLLGKLEPVKTGYQLISCCMDSTRQSILDRIVAWVMDPPEQSGASWRNTYWFYGSWNWQNGISSFDLF